MADATVAPETVSCQTCGAQFIRTGRRHNFCKDCAQERRRARQREAKRRELQERGEEINARRRERYAQDPEVVRQRNRAAYKRNPETYKKDALQWAERNPEKRREIVRRIQAKKRKDGAYRLLQSVRSQLRLCLRGKCREGRLFRLLGYTIEDLRAHLERQFLPGMSWDNYGKRWHIDHIRPISSFTFEGPEDDSFRECWALTNLRPLWARENLSKNGKREFLL